MKSQTLIVINTVSVYIKNINLPCTVTTNVKYAYAHVAICIIS